jgi:hypothetical protein
MLFMMKADPLTKKAMTSAMSRRKNPVAMPTVPSDAIKPWVPYYFARVDRPEGPRFVYIEQKRPDSREQMPQCIRVFYGKARALNLVNLLQPMGAVQPPSPRPTVLDLEPREPHSHKNGALRLYYVDTDIGQMFIHPDFQGDFGFANINESERRARRVSLMETAHLYQSLRSQTFYEAPALNRFREMDGRRHKMTVIDLEPSHVEELETWRRMTPSGLPAETLPIINDDGLRPSDLLE